jgi:toxin ParE1/3/4
MKIKESVKFKNNLKEILKYIAKDKKSAAINFRNDLKRLIESLTFMPYKYRKSYFYDDENIRDMVFKGYVISYLIDNDKIIILDIFKWRENDE